MVPAVENFSFDKRHFNDDITPRKRFLYYWPYTPPHPHPLHHHHHHYHHKITEMQDIDCFFVLLNQCFLNSSDLIFIGAPCCDIDCQFDEPYGLLGDH